MGDTPVNTNGTTVNTTVKTDPQEKKLASEPTSSGPTTGTTVKTKNKNKKNKQPTATISDNSGGPSSSSGPLKNQTASQTAENGSVTTKKKSQKRRKPKAKAASAADGDASTSNNDNAPTKASNNDNSNKKAPKKTGGPRFNKQRAQGQLTMGDGLATETGNNTQLENSNIKNSNNDSAGPSKPDDIKKKSNNKRKQRNNNKKKAPVSNLVPPPDTDDMATTMAYELSTSTYECMVCWDVVRPAHHTWTCDTCWAVFHITCIEKWATKSLKDTSTNMMITSWRCPGCQHKRTAIPQGYFCFCGKQQNPNPKHYQTPHTCEDLCKRSRKCPHPCVLPCHPGPCPPCTSMGPINICFCGKERRQARCVDTDYETNSFSCETKCDQRLGCGKHTCEEKCHGGLCRSCLVEEEHQSCYCGQTERNARCGSGVPAFAKDGRTGYYSCEKLCTSTYDCGVHRCGKKCHPCTELTTCPYDPSMIKTCPCGSSTTEDLLGGSTRQNCTDPIPTCGGICHKQLPCGHTCQQRCHRGACGPCDEHIKITCRCQSTEYDATCSTVSDKLPECSRVCKSTRNCGRHICGNTCCPASKLKGKKRAQGGERAHDCPLECGRLLSCGKHHCSQNCHKGPCPPCLEASFDDLTCHCGRTRLEAPVRCGTQLPHCPHPCQRPYPCGHVRLLHHNCHPDDEPCPPCPILISRECLCGKADLKNIPCYRESAHCGLICDKLLPCGEHRCKKSCHSGDCLTGGQVCTQPCVLTRTSCGHPCMNPCHGNTPCPETTPCSTRIRATCACGQNAMEIPCNSSATSSGSDPTLECNDFCAKILRNRRLASALEIQRDELSPSDAASAASSSASQQLSAADLGYYDDSIRDFYMENSRWCKQMEKQLIDFASDDSQTSLHFKPMRAHFRWFLHTYATHFNLGTEAMDPEPFRSVAARKNQGPCRIPPILLSKAIRDPKLMAPPPTAQPTEEATAIKQEPRSKKPPVNALKLSDLTFGVLQEDVDAILRPILNSATITYTTQWGKEGTDVVVTPDLDHITDMEEKENLIWQWKKGLQSAFLFNDVAGLVECCWINRMGEITWSENKITSKQVDKGKQAWGQPQRNRFGLLDNEGTSSAIGEEKGPAADSDGQQGTDDQVTDQPFDDDDNSDGEKDDDWIAIANEDVASDN
ncbi:hypothetical protein BC941DRAFT_414896 [Chlamydoabsidia padenii]|nr:hypothetical protein BC941DRAFT_414896 [Chlamydoabsidia padenii]